MTLWLERTVKNRIEIDDILREVQKPGRYVGGEWNAVLKEPQSVKGKIALVFPDLYEIGMSYLGQKILYHILNRHPDYLAERVFAPWPDFEAKLRKNKIPLFSLENRLPLYEFDLIGFSLLYELNYSNILTILDLGRIPLFASERDIRDPLICAGGPAAFNPEPVAEYFDLFLIGDGEEAFLEIVEQFIVSRYQYSDRREALKHLARIRGVYIPSLYTTFVPAHSSLLAVKPGKGAPSKIKKRILSPLRDDAFPDDIVVPNVKIIFDRISVEVERGCPQKCRFCQATSLYFPPRVKKPDEVIKTVLKSIHSTGYEDSSLTALSISDYPYFDQTVQVLMEKLEEKNISLSVSSLRPKGLSSEFVQNIIRVRKTGLTLVPEAGTERLRSVINKDMKDEDIWAAVETAFSRGWRLLKLYFMIGLPTEKQEDLEGIIRMVKEIVGLGYKKLRRAPQINMSVSSFIPKPHTAFQWEKMEEDGVLAEKYRFLKFQLKKYPFIKLREHDRQSTYLESMFSRGDRRLARVLEDAWRGGARFDSWNEHLKVSVWQEAIQRSGFDCRNYLDAIDQKAILPWDHIDTGIKKSHLKEEMTKALREERTPSCLEHDCDACRGCSLWPVIIKEFPGEGVHLSGEILLPIGKETDDVIRYRLQYSKQGKARYTSHLDLIDMIQRSFRRAGISVCHSTGYHPKMLMAYLPALPLGMEGASEVLEFKSNYHYTEKEILARLNEFTPLGLEFSCLERISPHKPVLGKDLDAMVYSLDLKTPGVKKALDDMRRKYDGPALSDLETVRMAVADYQTRPDGISVAEMAIDEKHAKLIINVKYSPQKMARPQEIVSEIIGMTTPAFDMTRDKPLFKSG